MAKVIGGFDDFIKANPKWNYHPEMEDALEVWMASYLDALRWCWEMNASLSDPKALQKALDAKQAEIK